MYLTILVFVFISSSALVISGQIPNPIRKLVVEATQPTVYPDLPVLNEGSSFPIVSAQGAFAVDLDSWVSLYEKNADNPLLPASTTKIITALVALDAFKLDDVLTVGKISVTGQKMGLKEGEQIKFEDLLYGLLVYSANDAAEAIAGLYPGGRDSFISTMNNKAAELSLKNTHFDNPVGLDADGQRSTAKDLVRASEVAMRNPEFARIVGTKNVLVKDVSGKFSYNLNNVNELLGSVPGVMGVKTGWTENARENLVTYVVRDNHKVMIAILGSQDRFGETKELIDWIFGSYKWTEVKSP